ncbi:MAG TPA: prephenate dehydrogenase [Deltaproteobacteria bacterium]|nr:prephenate dehydrogenase [Deltaproteobacteria bacterium]
MKIAVIGLGLIGASLAKSLAGRAEITGIDRDPGVVDMAMLDRVISRGGGDPSLASGCDMAVIALPVGSIVDAARSLLPHLGPDTPLTDTGSTKARIAREIESFWPCFVGSHPIAGKENPGYCASQSDLFAGRPCIITPGAHTQQECVHQVRQIWEACGSRVTIMDPMEHDRLMAVISHMPHLLSFASMGLAGDLHIHRGLLGAGFRDFTRIAASDPVMWRDIFLDNSGHILKLLDNYVRELGLMREIIGGRDASALEERLRTYSMIRRNLYEDNR